MNHYAGRMTKTYAAKRLLEHGPLTAAQFIEITGWEERTCRRTLQQLVDTEVATIWNPPRLRHATRHYALASSPFDRAEAIRAFRWYDELLPWLELRRKE
jgi:hypothetical protein